MFLLNIGVFVFIKLSSKKIVANANGRVCFVLDIRSNSHHEQAHRFLPVFPSDFKMKLQK